MTSEGHEDNGHEAESFDTPLSTLRYQQMMRMRSPTPTQEEQTAQSQQEELLSHDGPSSSHIPATPMSHGSPVRSRIRSSQLRFKSAPEPIHNVLSEIEVNLEELWQSFICLESQEAFDEHGSLIISGLLIMSAVEAESIEGEVKAVVSIWMERWHPLAEVEWHSLGSLVKGKGRARG